MVTILNVMGFKHFHSKWDENFQTQNFLGILSIRVSILLHDLSTRHLRLNISVDPSRVDVRKGKRVSVKSFNTLRTGLLNCLNARSWGLTFRHRASCI